MRSPSTGVLDALPFLNTPQPLAASAAAISTGCGNTSVLVILVLLGRAREGGAGVDAERPATWTARSRMDRARLVLGDVTKKLARLLLLALLDHRHRVISPAVPNHGSPGFASGSSGQSPPAAGVVELERRLPDQRGVAIGLGIPLSSAIAVGGGRELDVVLLQRKRGAGEQGRGANSLAAAFRQVQLLRRGRLPLPTSL